MQVRQAFERSLVRSLVMVAVIGFAARAAGEDWPMWRHDARRSAASPETLPETLHLQWVREYPRLKPAWPAQVARGYLTFDVSYKPVVMGKRMFVGSSLNHRLTALDTETGKEVWRFYAGGPIRFAPVCSKGKVYFVSDDGHLYCLSAADGSLKWRVLGGPDNRKILGNGHLVSLWPARGAPALAGGTIYFGASLWPFVGSFLYALDAETGKAVWVNSGTGAQFKPAYSLQGSGLLVRPGMYGSVAQGYLVVAHHRLAVPQGRNVAQLFDRKTGKLIFNEIYGMHVRHDSSEYWYALTAGRSVFSGPIGSAGVSVDTGRMSFRNPVGNSITAEKTVYSVSSGNVAARVALEPYRPLWQFRLTTAAAPTGPGSYIKAGKNLYIPGAANQLLIVKDADTGKRALAVGPKIPGGRVWDMLAADGKLFTVTIDGKIACFGRGEKGKVITHEHRTSPLRAAGAGVSKKADEILKAAGQNEGYCLVLGVADGELAQALLAKSKMNIIAVDPDEEKIAGLRRRIDEAGLYGERLSAHVGDPLAFGFPPYLANLIVSETLSAGAAKKASAMTEMMRILRPYGGTICLPKRGGGYALTVRKGALAGAADWTHNNADAANALVGHDKLIKAPLGVLWFGGPTNKAILPRHGRGPAPAVAAGRLFIEGRNIIRAIDIYTGRLLWERNFPNIGVFYDTGAKQLGTHETGPNYASAADGVYVITPRQCLALDPATGETAREFALPAGVKKDSLWASVRVAGGVLVATIRPIDVKRNFTDNSRQGAGAQWLAVYNRRTGEALWSKKAALGFRSSGVAVTADRVFCIDGLSKAELEQAKRRGMAIPAKPSMCAFEVKSGKQLWKVDEDIFGTWLGYSAERDTLVQAGCGRGDPTELAGHKASNGSRMWRQPEANDPKPPRFAGPPMLHHDRVIPQHGRVVGLLDGKLQTRPEPLTGKPVPWTAAAHGCGFAHAGENMIFQRAWSTGGFIELRSAPRITGLGGFRSGCTANMVPAGGIVTVPDYTRVCECQFKNQTSLALIHMPDADAWTFELGAPAPTGRVERLGLNFNAPGDRTSDEGTLWLDCPDSGGPSTQVSVTLEPSKSGVRRNWRGNWRRSVLSVPVFAGPTFRHHNTAIKSGPLKWVTASGLSGVTTVKVGLFYPAGAKDTAAYTIRLYFAEPRADAKVGERAFSVKLQGKEALRDFDVVKEAGGPRRGIVEEFKNVRVADVLTVELRAKAGAPLLCGLEAVIEK